MPEPIGVVENLFEGISSDLVTDTPKHCRRHDYVSAPRPPDTHPGASSAPSNAYQTGAFPTRNEVDSAADLLSAAAGMGYEDASSVVNQKARGDIATHRKGDTRLLFKREMSFCNTGISLARFKTTSSAMNAANKPKNRFTATK